MIEVSEDFLWARVGRLTVENELLRRRVAELEAARTNDLLLKGDEPAEEQAPPRRCPCAD